jgi:hypothetical protein
VTEDEVDRTHRALEGLRGCQESRQVGDPRVIAFSQRVGVVADDVEDPEGQGRTSEVAGQLPMAPAHEVDRAVEVLGLAEVLGSQGPRFDEAKDECTRLAVDDLGRDAGCMGGSAGRPR